MEDLKKLLAAATPGPWTHASDKLAAGNIKAPDNACLIVAAVNALPELLARVRRYESALQAIADNAAIDTDAPLFRAQAAGHARAALNQEPGQ